MTSLSSIPTKRLASAASSKRLIWWIGGFALLGLLIWQAATSSGGTPDPTATSSLSRSAVVLDSGLLVLREGLETILVLAAVTASMRSGNERLRRPIALGGGAALGASVATWFAAIALTSAVGESSLSLQAGTGLLAVIVLLVVMNWFFHRVYWTGWISSHNRRRRALMSGASRGMSARRTLLGLGLLGFTSVYREGFEVVLFLQSLRLRYGSGVVLEGVAVGLALTSAIGLLTFVAHRRLPYRKMLVTTGILLGVVLLVMVGESVQEMQQAGWIGVDSIPISVPGWMGLWLSVFPNVESVAAQLLAAILVIGSYFLSEEMRVRRPRRRRDQRRNANPSRPAPQAGPSSPQPAAGTPSR